METESVTGFGWQGIGISVPASWELGAHHGARDEGYACLDDGREMRLQVRWTRPKRKAADLEGLLRRYQRSLAKASKGTVHFDRLDPETLSERLREEKMVAPFAWRSNRDAHGLVSYCRGCGRMVLMEILFPAGEADHSLARRIMGSMTDHSNDGWALWSVYGFAFSVPASYNLAQADLAPGRLRFLFRSARRSWLRVERWALASQWMEKAALDAWPEELLKLMRVSRRGPVEKNEGSFREHRAVRFAATVTGRGFLRRDKVAGVLWHCPEEDKAFVVMAAGGHDGLPDEVADTVKVP